MKVVHINTLDYGGAANSALRLHNGLLKEGISSSFLSLFMAHNGPSKFSYSQKPFRHTLATRLKARLHHPLDQGQRNEAKIKGKEGIHEAFTFPETDYDLENHPLVKEADIVHLHWVANFINYPTFFRGIQKPIVWTLHDMNPFQGGFHYLEDKERNQEVFGPLEEEFLSLKARLVKESNIHVVTPSKWLGECSRQSEVLGRFPHSYIPYGLDLNAYKPRDSRFSKEVFNLPLDKKVILFVSENVNNHRKGFDLLLEAIRDIDLQNEYCLVTMGAVTQIETSQVPVFHMGRLSDERLISLLYSAADLYILPSREDNLPNVMLESLACGTPVLAFEVGGAKDAIQSGKNGLLVKEKTSEALKRGILEIAQGNYPLDSKEIRKLAEERYPLSLQAKRYMALYHSLIKADPQL